VLAAMIVVPAAALAFVAVERRAADPLIPLAYLRRRNFVFPMGVQVFSNFAYMGGFILAPLLLERVYGLSESHTGLVVIARPIAFSVSAPIAGYLAVRLGERTSVVAGALAIGASMLVFASLNPRSADIAIASALVLSGVGMGVATPSVAASVANAVDDMDLGVASAAQQLLAQIGVVAGIQVMATIQVSAQANAGLMGSFRDAYLLGAIFSVGAVICGAFVQRHHRHKSDPELAGATVSIR
jgi:MFS family permease